MFVPYWNLSRRSAGGDFLIHTQSWIVSGRSADGEFLLHTPHWKLCSVSSRRGRGEGKSRALDVILLRSFVEWGVSLTRPVLECVSPLSGSGVSLTRPALESVSPFVVWGISLTRPVLACLVLSL